MNMKKNPMVETLLTKQVGQFLQNATDTSLYITAEFQLYLNKLRNGEMADTEFLELFSSEERILLNSDLITRCPSIIMYVQDPTKKTVLDILYKLFFAEKDSNYRDPIIKIFTLIVNSIKDIELRKRYANITTHLLAEDPCNKELRKTVEAIIQRDDPSFRFQA